MKLRGIVIRILSFVPAILLAFMISGFSAETGETSGDLSLFVSEKIVMVKNILTFNAEANNDTAAVAEEAAAIHHYVRKAAHMTEYCLFSLAVSLIFFAFQTGWKIRVPGTVLTCFFLASCDEIHQMFVPGRGPAFTDVLIDTAGAVIGVILLEAVIGIVIHCKKRSGKI